MYMIRMKYEMIFFISFQVNLLRGEDVIWMFVIPQIYISLLNLTVIYGHAVITSWIRHFEFINRIFPENIGVAKFIAKYILIHANVVAVCMGATLKFL